MKKCFKCNRRKPLDAFYKHSRMADGRLNKCADCTKRDVKERYRKTVEKRREYERNREKTAHRRKMKTVYRETYRSRHPMKIEAHRLVTKALRSGLLKREPCELCGDRAEAHHDDYTKPL